MGSDCSSSWSLHTCYFSHGIAHLSRIMRKPTFWFPTWSETNQAVQLQKMARGLKFRIYVVEGLYYPYSENKGADQLRGYREADLRLCFAYAKHWFSHGVAHFVLDLSVKCPVRFKLILVRSQTRNP